MTSRTDDRQAFLLGQPCGELHGDLLKDGNFLTRCVTTVVLAFHLNRMILLVSGATATLRQLNDPRLGHFIVPGAGNHPDSLPYLRTRPWAMDNAAFIGFSERAFLRMLARYMYRRQGCRFVTVPDTVGNAVITCQQFLFWEPMIHSLGFPVAFVAQDGLTAEMIPWDRFEAFFIGGTTEWKMGATVRTFVSYAKTRGKWIHMGRVNTRNRLHYAVEIGCDSADGSGFSKWSKINLPKALNWLDQLCPHASPTTTPFVDSADDADAAPAA